jgi:hypothetical protein
VASKLGQYVAADESTCAGDSDFHPTVPCYARLIAGPGSDDVQRGYRSDEASTG